MVGFGWMRCWSVVLVVVGGRVAAAFSADISSRSSAISSSRSLNVWCTPKSAFVISSYSRASSRRCVLVTIESCPVNDSSCIRHHAAILV